MKCRQNVCRLNGPTSILSISDYGVIPIQLIQMTAAAAGWSSSSTVITLLREGRAMGILVLLLQFN